ncbi:MAG: hypothetical protein V4446_15055 [Pseudomonadota bacterium]
MSKIKPGWLMETRGSRTPATMAVPGSIVLNGAYDAVVTNIRFSPGFKVQVKQAVLVRPSSVKSVRQRG